jgi:hypothetical protein
MNPDTAQLVRALGAINQHMPQMVNDVLIGQMPPAKQHEFADLLIELGELLHRHADTRDEQAPAVSGNTTPPAGPVEPTDSEEQQL